MQNHNLGTLYVVATPIGNLDDITLRALNTLKSVDFILAEDTRTSAKLLSHFGIEKKLISYHHHNEKSRVEQIEKALSEGSNIALISDAGTPLISDPGYVIVNYLREHDFNVIPIPGPSAMITALSASGLKTDQFQFIGFLPAKRTSKEKELKELQNYPGVNVIYEAPHRLIDTLEAIKQVLGDQCSLVLAKELTKQYEHFISGNVDEVLNWLDADKLRLKGEFVLLIDTSESKNDKTAEEKTIDETLTILLKHIPVKQAAKVASELLSLKKNALYQRALELTKVEE
ncbi:16S rRNA (cytidine(1402)-2'-O)-methyltransferase [Thiotrichales bacterium 19S9-12]|nr:16S rRNA (cytidine(1402)-2'-O)-methyltransferase [Thiotrichales bacterium 19S9-11]MCF6811921.1 16S rRNA (cytidine(1402)-2'-O)-methyltransferase [Thiotrichales bacterium 19S9-12]